ncbi:hypothetical protein E6O75_ATG01393 [Venturia nashicola]|uniref:Uncharacterized protein n=1 Tax=Venturia nashicola TaxID=86259 RepID=A0A4Z1PDP7_9PEZI|nr:hypothetical protein E6O75_ATG01393 [Venturia nashicola]
MSSSSLQHIPTNFQQQISAHVNKNHRQGHGLESGVLILAPLTECFSSLNIVDLLFSAIPLHSPRAHYQQVT